MNLEKGQANHPQRIAQTIKTALAFGMLGVAVEDASGSPDHPDNLSGQTNDANR